MAPSPFCLNIMIIIQDKEQDRLPGQVTPAGEGNEGMEQLESGGKVSVLVAVLTPPVIIRPVLESCIKYKQRYCLYLPLN